MAARVLTVRITHHDGEFPPTVWEEMFRTLPEAERREIARFRRGEDRRARLLGKLLLRKSLREYGYGPDCLERIERDGYGRPFLAGAVDFNISHSGRYVVCAVSDEGDVGIDVERVRPIELADFEDLVPPLHWKAIKESTDSDRSFCGYWTMYESVIKADGGGLSVAPGLLRLEGNRAVLGGRERFLKEILIDPDYICHLAAIRADSECVVEREDWSALA